MANILGHVLHYSSSLLNNCIQLDIAGHNCAERSNEDLTVEVEDVVVEVRALYRVHTK